MSTITCRQLRTGLSDTLNRVAYAGERVVVERNGKPMAVLVSVEDLAVLEAIEEAEDLRDLKSSLAEARIHGTAPLEEFIRQQEAKP